MPPRPRPRRQVAPTSQTIHLPAPVGGVNTVAAGLDMPLSDCVSAVNLISAENGLRARYGYREWCTNVTSTSTVGVPTVIPYTGSDAANSRLFTATDTGIWDVSTSTNSPTLEFTFATQTGNAGYGSYAAVVTSAGHFLLYADEVNGLHVYTESTTTWAAVTQGVGATQIDGVNPARIAFVAVFKGRVWLVERDTASAWYLAPGAIYGTATKFPFGGIFREGGTLVGLWNWTYDGGAGIDDSLVAVSTGGDVVVYQGTDPSAADTFSLRGVWQMGAPPNSRRIGTTTGGDLLLLSRQGIVPMSKLVVGSASGIEYATAKVANYLNRLMVERASLYAWGIVQHPEDNSLVLLIPRGTNATHLQLAQAVASRGWFSFEDLPILSAAAWNGKLYFGTDDGRVCVNSGYLDSVTLDGLTYEPVQWRMLSAFSTFGAPREKQIQLIRPLLISDTAPPTVSVAARYDYDQTDLPPVAFSFTAAEGWDAGTWDSTVWGGGTSSTRGAHGTTGCGFSVAVVIRGTSIGRTVLVGMDVAFTSGGPL